MEVLFIMNLIDECLFNLGDRAIILESEEQKIIEREFYRRFPMTSWGRIDWSKIELKQEVSTIQEISRLSLDLTTVIFIIWSDLSLPVLKLPLDVFFNHIDDILSVSFDTWLLFESLDMVIEIYHENKIMIGQKTVH